MLVCSCNGLFVGDLLIGEIRWWVGRFVVICKTNELMPKHEVSSPELNSARFKRKGGDENCRAAMNKSLDGLMSWLSSHDAVINSVAERNVPGLLVKGLLT